MAAGRNSTALVCNGCCHSATSRPALAHGGAASGRLHVQRARPWLHALPHMCTRAAHHTKTQHQSTSGGGHRHTDARASSHTAEQVQGMIHTNCGVARACQAAGGMLADALVHVYSRRWARVPSQLSSQRSNRIRRDPPLGSTPVVAERYTNNRGHRRHPCKTEPWGPLQSTWRVPPRSVSKPCGARSLTATAAGRQPPATVYTSPGWCSWQDPPSALRPWDSPCCSSTCLGCLMPVAAPAALLLPVPHSTASCQSCCCP
jgi:hypothetical protein